MFRLNLTGEAVKQGPMDRKRILEQEAARKIKKEVLVR